MDEAEIIGDRIAIMKVHSGKTIHFQQYERRNHQLNLQDGNIKAYGTTLFLKNLGGGYDLAVDKAENYHTKKFHGIISGLLCFHNFELLIRDKYQCALTMFNRFYW